MIGLITPVGFNGHKWATLATDDFSWARWVFSHKEKGESGPGIQGPKVQKLEPRAEEGILVGFEGSSIYRVFVPGRKGIVRSSTVVFDEAEKLPDALQDPEKVPDEKESETDPETDLEINPELESEPELDLGPDSEPRLDPEPEIQAKRPRG